MQDVRHLPPELETGMADYGIQKEDVYYAAQTDLASDGRLAQGCLLLTAEALILLQAEPAEGEVFEFKGVHVRHAKSAVHGPWHMQRYPLSELKELDVIRNVSGGILYAKDPDRSIAWFTNFRMDQLRQLTKLFAALKEKGTLTEEDFRVEEDEEYCPQCGTMYPDKNRKVCPRCTSFGSLMHRVAGWFQPYWVKLALLVVCMAATAALNMLVPYLNGVVLYEKVLGRSDAFLAQLGLPAGEYVIALLMVVLTLLVTRFVMQVFSALRNVLMDQAVLSAIRDVKSRIFENMARLSVSFYTSRQTGGLMTRVLNDTDDLTYFFFDFPWIVLNLLTLALTIPILFVLNWKLALVTVALLPPAIFFAWKMSPVIENMYGKRHRAERSMNGKIHDNLMGGRVIKAFGRETEEEEAFERHSQRVRKAEIALVVYSNRFYIVFNILKYFMTAMAWGVGAWLIARGENMTLALLITFVGYVQQMQDPIDMFSYALGEWSGCKNNMQRILEILDSMPEVTEKENAIHLPEGLRGDVELEDVTFGYEPNKPVLKQISLQVHSGEMLGVVGRSGAGKTTLVNLISRLYDPQEGTVRLDGIDVKDLSFDSLRGEVAMVSQETYIFMGTVRENIAYARPDAAAEEIMQAARLASAHDFICAMPNGYDTMIGSGGRELSGGERQRISITRAILADPKILILDEATAAVDTETERAIAKSLQYLVKGRTTISIAHRLSTLKDADRLIVLDDGRITEEGTHDELIAQKGTYYKLRELQTKALAMRGLE